MSQGRYVQLTSVLHFNENSDEEVRARDSLHKIQPLSNILKKTLGKYAMFGNALVYDEATMVNKSSFGRSLICFNPMKPTGKFHFKIYMICCAKTNLMLQMKIHTRDNSDVELDDNFNELMNKLDNQTVQLCKPFFNSGWSILQRNHPLKLKVCSKIHLFQYKRGTKSTKGNTSNCC
jgi:hypothetical protein